MTGLRSLLNEVRVKAGQLPTPPSPRPRPTLAVTGASDFHGYICLQYLVTPVPVELSADTSLFEGEAGIAVDDHARIYKECSIAYRRSGDGHGVIGAFKVAPALRSGTATLRVLFPPLALTPELDHALCEIELAITGDRVEPVAIRWA